MSKYTEIIGIVVVILAVGLVLYGSYILSRWMNWKMGYEGMTNKQIEKVMTEHINKYHDGIKK